MITYRPLSGHNLLEALEMAASDPQWSPAEKKVLWEIGEYTKAKQAFYIDPSPENEIAANNWALRIREYPAPSGTNYYAGSIGFNVVDNGSYFNIGLLHHVEA